MADLVGMIAVISALISGSIVGIATYSHYSANKRKGAMKALLGSSSLLDALSISLESSGISQQVITHAIRLSREEKDLPFWFVRMFSTGWKAREHVVMQAGLEGFISQKGYAAASFRFFAIGGAFGAIIGAIFSSALSTIGLIIGCVSGLAALSRALKEEAQNRSFVAEKQLSQMIEIVILGLKSGMTFDRALVLFHSNFKGSLSSSLALVQSQWMHGFIERSEGLRSVARSYDSSLFERFAENVIRSLRFGTSLANNLSLLSSEARAVRKAKLEEKVAKAPVKMLLPVGALILPAMLILIMGPIMLDLMQGF